jgi:hypothetical protein
MGRLTIFGKQLTKAEITELTTLAQEAGYNASEIDVVDEIGKPDLNAENDVIVLLGTPAACADPDLEMNLKKAANGPRRAIWIWPKDGGAAKLPPAAANYCYSYIQWSADKLHAVAADDDTTCFVSATGEPTPKVPTERNLCADEEEKA